MRWLVTLVIVCACDSGSPPASPKPAPQPQHPTEHECELLLAHIVDLEFAPNAQLQTTKEIAKAKASVVSAKRDEFVAACRPMTSQRVACVQAATSLDGMAACDRTTPPN